MKKDTKIIIGIIITVVIAVLCVIVFFMKKDKENQNVNNNLTSSGNEIKDIGREEIVSEKGIKTVLTLEDEIQNNTVWCGTFQLIWNDLKNELAKQDIKFEPQLEVVKNLNKETFKTTDISDKYYYKKIGIPSIELKEEIKKAIKDKLNETSDILDDFDFANAEPTYYFLYVMLKKDFEFEKEFQEFENGKFGEYLNTKYFGIKKDNKNSELRNQVSILYYNSKDDFAIKLKTKKEDEVIFCKNPKANTFNSIYKDIANEENKYKGKKYIQEGETVKIPYLKLDEKVEFTEIEHKLFYFSDGHGYEIDKALQTIKFELDRTGGKIKSEAGMMIKDEAIMIDDEIRSFEIDNSFAIFLKEKDKEVPYFAAKVDDISKFQ